MSLRAYLLKDTISHCAFQILQINILVFNIFTANYFTSSDITLHERFSKIQEKPIANMNEVKIHLDPEIHR